MFGRKKPLPPELQDDDDIVEVQALPAPPESRPLPASPLTTAKRLPATTATREERTFIGSAVTLEGTLRFKGQARIEGTFKGTIAQGMTLEVGPDALVEADATIESLLIQGRMAGNVTASQSVEITAGGRMKGDIRTPAFQVHRGAIFTGHCEMGEH